jgi:hypothetical protein
MQSVLSILPFSNAPSQGLADLAAEGSGDGVFASMIGADPVLPTKPAADPEISSSPQTNPEAPVSWLNWLVPPVATASVPDGTGEVGEQVGVPVAVSDASADAGTVSQPAGWPTPAMIADRRLDPVPGGSAADAGWPTPGMIADRRLDPVPGNPANHAGWSSFLSGSSQTIFAGMYGSASGGHYAPLSQQAIVPPVEPIRPKTGENALLAGAGDPTRPHIALLPAGFRPPVTGVSPDPATGTTILTPLVAPDGDGQTRDLAVPPGLSAVTDDSLASVDNPAEVDANPAELPGGSGTGVAGLALPEAAATNGVATVAPAADFSWSGRPDGEADPAASHVVSAFAARPTPVEMAPPAAMPVSQTALQTLLTEWVQSLDDSSSTETGLALATMPGTQTSVATATLPSPAALPVPQIAAQITGALARTANGSTELTLSPEELGRVQLRLEADAADPDRMVVMISFERPETLDLFRRHAGELAEAIRAAGYSGADIGFGHEGGSQAGDRQDGFAKGGPHSSATTSLPPAPERPRLMAGSSLDLRL